MALTNTPYDDSFRTMLTDCKRLVIPLVNELFGTSYTGNEKVSLFQNELFITAGGVKKRITDSNFTISDEEKHYNIECQSSPDGTMIVRMFEYASQTAIVNGERSPAGFRFVFPYSGVIQLRGRVSEKYTIIIEVPGSSTSYDIPVINIRDYTMDEVLSKRLWFLLPFMFFNYDLKKADADPEEIENIKTNFETLWLQLDQQVDAGAITEFEKCCIKAMCKNVAEALTKEYANVKEGVETVMGGVILDYEAKRILNQGIERGVEKGIEQERRNAIKRVTENYMKADPSLTREEAEERAKAILA